jgi:hypothetical protein
MNFAVTTENLPRPGRETTGSAETLSIRGVSAVSATYSGGIIRCSSYSKAFTLSAATALGCELFGLVQRPRPPRKLALWVRAKRPESEPSQGEPII